MGMRITGLDEVVRKLRNVGDRIVDGGRAVLYSEADRIVDQARINAPVDKHNLENAIRRDSGAIRRFSFVITVSVGGYVGNVNVTQYALLIHENYASMKPGPGTVQKRAANPGHYVGEKFLTRALEQRRGRLVRVMGEFVDREWHL